MGPRSVLRCPKVPWSLLSDTVPVGFNSSGNPLDKHSYAAQKLGCMAPNTVTCPLLPPAACMVPCSPVKASQQREILQFISSLISPCSVITVSPVFSSRVKLNIKFSKTIESSYNGPHCGKFQGIPDQQLAQPYLLPGPGIVIQQSMASTKRSALSLPSWVLTFMLFIVVVVVVVVCIFK